MKTSAAVILISVGGAAAWSQPSRASLRSLGQKQVVMKGPSRVNGNTMKMEGALLFVYFRVSGRLFFFESIM